LIFPAATINGGVFAHRAKALSSYVKGL